MAREVIASLAASRKWHGKTIRTLLARLVRKRAIAFQRQGRSYLYRPRVNQADCARMETEAFLERVFDGAPAPLIALLLEGRKISDSEARELRLLLDAKNG